MREESGKVWRRAVALRARCDHISEHDSPWLQNARSFLPRFVPLWLWLMLGACGGESSNDGLPGTAQLRAQEIAAPPASGDVASDGLIWFNFRRQQAGLLPLARDAVLDQAATAHAQYQLLNHSVAHEENPGRPGFTGFDAPQRLQAAGFPLTTATVADGEVIAATARPDGFAAADGLITAIYHRYLIFEPRFSTAGAGAATRPGAYSWLTVNMVAPRQSSGLGKGQLVVWPHAGQRSVRANFYSNQETPDPVPHHDEVGYPVSVHADFSSVLKVQRFMLRERDGRLLAVRQLDSDSDRDTPPSAAAIVPLLPLRASTDYDVEFSGTIDGQPVSRQWSFRTL